MTTFNDSVLAARLGQTDTMGAQQQTLPGPSKEASASQALAKVQAVQLNL